jgi:hypothetical protein
MYEVLLAFTLLDIALNIYYHSKWVDSFRFDPWREIKDHHKHLITCTYMLCLVFTDTSNEIFYAIEFIIMFIVYRKATDIYQCIKVTEFSLKY